MIEKTRLAGGLAVFVIVIGVSVLPASASSPRPTALGGTVTMTGTETYVREVTIPRTVTFKADAWFDLWKITSSRGRFAGFALRKAGPDATGAAFAINLGYCLTRGCQRAPWAGYANGCVCAVESPDPDTYVFTPGRYRLYLIADGAPVTVTLRLPGLTGLTSFRTGTPHRVTIDTPNAAVLEPPLTPAGAGGNRYSAGNSHKSPAGGLHYLIAWKFLVSPPKSVNQIGGCRFDGAATPGPSGLYQYPCDAGGAADIHVGGQVETGSTTGPMGTLPQYATFVELFGVYDPGTLSLGAYVNSHSPATEVHTQIFWLDFIR